MAKVFIEESTLTGIGDAIREKEGTAELIPVNDMKARILAIQSGGSELPEEAFNITGDCSYRFINGGWDWFVELYGNQVTTKDVSVLTNCFKKSGLTRIPFVVNIATSATGTNSCFSNMENLAECPRIRGTFKANTNLDLTDTISNCKRLRDVEDLLEPSMLDEFSAYKVTASYTTPKAVGFNACYSLRKIPSWWYKFKLNPESTTFPSNTNTVYYYAFTNCYTLDEIKNVPVWVCTAACTSNMFSNSVNNNYRIKSFTFETDENSQPIVTKWKSQTIDLTTSGFCNSSNAYNLTYYNSGITTDKRVYDDATYQALKNDPDWFSQHDIQGTAAAYSRYNHDSAVETINSLPDTSAYLASAGGTNTIKFKGTAGSKTDGGAINTLTAEEIAVAAAKGWTVSIA